MPTLTSIKWTLCTAVLFCATTSYGQANPSNGDRSPEPAVLTKGEAQSPAERRIQLAIETLRQSQARGDVVQCRAALKEVADYLLTGESRDGMSEAMQSQAINAVFSASAFLNATDIFGMWIDQAARSDLSLLRQVIATIEVSPAGSASSVNLDFRLSNLQLQKRAVERWLGSLDDAGRSSSTTSETLDRLCRPWNVEAEQTLAPKAPSREAAAPGMGARPPIAAPPQPPKLAADQLYGCASSDAWLARLSPDARRRQQLLIYQLQVACLRFDAALKTLSDLASSKSVDCQPQVALLLRAWTKANASVVENATTGTAGRKVALSISEAAQARHLNELATLAGQLRAITGRPLPAEALVAAFSGTQSRTAIYRQDDLERVFGPANMIDTDCLLPLATSMRASLLQPNSSDSVAQLDQLYQTLESPLQARLSTANDPRLQRILGVILFDHADLSQSNGIDLRTGSARREKAYAAFEAAAKSLMADPATVVAQDGIVGLYEQWFNCALGATDVARISGDSAPDVAQIEAIRLSLQSMPEMLSSRVIPKIAARLNDNARQVPSIVVQEYVRQAISALGRDYADKGLLAMASYYDDILRELRLVCSIDGNMHVSKDAIFGVRIALQHTRQLDREVGGFSSIVQPAMSNATPSTTGAVRKASLRGRINYLERLERSLRKAAGDKIEVVNLLFVDGAISPRPIGDQDWQETPLAYAVVRVKDPSVDVIPQLQLDLDFGDQTASDSVMLPIVSSPVSLDARFAEERPFELAEVTQTLNDRDRTASDLTLEITVKGSGMIPTLDQILQTTNCGDVTVKNTVDQGLKAVRYNASPKASASDPVGGEVETERSWVVTFALNGDPGFSKAVFRFPALTPQAAAASQPSIRLQRYTENDITRVKSEIEIHGQPSTTMYLAYFLYAIGVFGIAGSLAAVLILRRRWQKPIDSRVAVAFPQHFTPFSAAVFLKSLKSDHCGQLSAASCADLDQQIGQFDQAFSPNSETKAYEPTSEQIREILVKWSVLLSK